MRRVVPKQMAFLNAIAMGILSSPADYTTCPNFFGTLIDYQFSSQPVSVLFLALAGGTLVFVIGELLDRLHPRSGEGEGRAVR